MTRKMEMDVLVVCENFQREWWIEKRNEPRNKCWGIPILGGWREERGALKKTENKQSRFEDETRR